MRSPLARLAAASQRALMPPTPAALQLRSDDDTSWATQEARGCAALAGATAAWLGPERGLAVRVRVLPVPELLPQLGAGGGTGAPSSVRDVRQLVAAGEDGDEGLDMAGAERDAAAWLAAGSYLPLPQPQPQPHPQHAPGPQQLQLLLSPVGGEQQTEVPWAQTSPPLQFGGWPAPQSVAPQWQLQAGGGVPVAGVPSVMWHPALGFLALQHQVQPQPQLLQLQWQPQPWDTGEPAAYFALQPEHYAQPQLYGQLQGFAPQLCGPALDEQPQPPPQPQQVQLQLPWGWHP